jgi:ring-1,2-phenylacetyl-CoA epoxidase subunit PaaD
MIEAIDITDRAIRVELLPTFVGCPAIDVIRDAVATRLGLFGRPVEVDVSFRVPWSSDRITLAGREKLRRSGFAPPAAEAADASDVRCPYCGSNQVALDNLFGPTQCRSLFYCRACRQPFEQFKAV